MSFNGLRAGVAGGPTAALCSLAIACAAAAQPQRIVIDGALDNWASGVSAVADGERILLRFDPPEVYTLQSGPVSTVLVLDVDSTASTGFPSGDAAQPLGVDIEIMLSPPDYNRPGSIGRGVQVHVFGEDGLVEGITHADAGFMCLPTYASPSYEIRLNRSIAKPAWVGERLAKSSRLIGRFEQRDVWGEASWISPPFTVDLPPVRSATPAAALPAKPDGAIRVMTWNVLWGAPMRDPAPFARVLRAIGPDIVLIQEWDNRRREEPRIPLADLQKWFRAHAPNGQAWTVVQSKNERGVLIASPHATRAFLPDGVDPVAATGESISFEHDVRMISARVKTPIGDVGAVSVHLSCCGSKDSIEDRRRMAEARALAQAIEEASIAGGPEIVIVGGDFNLVGSRAPLDTLLAAHRLDGSALIAADPLALDGLDATTWREADNDFSPGRLDWVVVGGKGVEVVRSFIFDSRDLSDEALRAAGLERADSDGSDHLPVVVDIRRAQ